MITGDQIDEKLVEEISGDLPCSVTGVTHYKTQRGIISEVLAWLANNPIIPSDAQADELWHHPKTLHGKEHYSKAMARSWQRIAYLKKKEEVVPDEIQKLLNNWNPKGPAREDILAAYRLGKGDAA